MCPWFDLICLSHSGVPEDSRYLTAYAMMTVPVITDDLKALCFFKTTVTIYQYTRLNIPEHLNLRSPKLLVQTPNRKAEYSGWRSCGFAQPAGERRSSAPSIFTVRGPLISITIVDSFRSSTCIDFYWLRLRFPLFCLSEFLEQIDNHPSGHSRS